MKERHRGIDLQVEADRQQQLLRGIQAGLIQSAHDLSEGGLAIALAESVFTGKGLGVEVDLAGDATVALFSETQSRFLVTVRPEHKEDFETTVDNAVHIGLVTNNDTLLVRVNGTTK